MSIFDHTDDDGDRIMITKAESGHWVVGIVGHQGDIAQMILDDEAIARLHKVSGPDIKPATVREQDRLGPENERRVAALRVGIPIADSVDELIQIADWILNSDTAKAQPQNVVNVTVPDSIDPNEVAKHINRLLRDSVKAPL